MPTKNAECMKPQFERVGRGVWRSIDLRVGKYLVTEGRNEDIQNLFEQPPLNWIVEAHRFPFHFFANERIVQTHGCDIMKVLIRMCVFGWDFLPLTPVNRKRFFGHVENDISLHLNRYRDMGLVRDQGLTPHEAIEMMIDFVHTEIKQYPLLDEYIKEYLIRTPQTVPFRRDGSVRHGHKPQKIKTYAAWAAEKMVSLNQEKSPWEPLVLLQAINTLAETISAGAGYPLLSLMNNEPMVTKE